MYWIGCGKSDITAFEKGAGMLGYGMYFNTMEEIETPLYARAFVVYDESRQSKFCIVNCELAFITIALQQGVLKKLAQFHPSLQYTDRNLMLTAQHTHSGPGGFSYYAFYNMSTPGFVQSVYEKLVDGVTEAIVSAEKNLQRGTIKIGNSDFDVSADVSFNRSVHAYNQNPEVQPKISVKDAHLGTNREMVLLHFLNEKNEPLGSINWFGVHTTTISNQNHKLCSDNKGYASQYLEEAMIQQGHRNFIGAFAQGICGDVTSKFVFNRKHPYQRGKYEGRHPDDFESARYNGQLQFEKAAEIIEHHLQPIRLAAPECETLYVDFSDVLCQPRFTKGETDARTGEAALGMSFFGGTVIDGPGAHPILCAIGRSAINLVKVIERTRASIVGGEYREHISRKYRAHGRKHVLMETHAHKMFGIRNLNHVPIPSFAEPSIGALKKFYRKNGQLQKPWTPKVLPLQLCVLGEIALAAFPFEITVIAGQRLQNSLQERLSTRGITRVILVPYANGYSGYITTREEYDIQIYEGGHTVFGQWSLAALQTKFDELAEQLLLPPAERELPHSGRLPHFTEEELFNEFPFFKAKWYLRWEQKQKRKTESV